MSAFRLRYTGLISCFVQPTRPCVLRKHTLLITLRVAYDECVGRLAKDDPFECFDSPGEWRRYLSSRVRALPCFDCCPAFQAEMVAEGRCRHPEAYFRQTRSGTWRGHLDERSEAALRGREKARRKTRRASKLPGGA